MQVELVEIKTETRSKVGRKKTYIEYRVDVNGLWVGYFQNRFDAELLHNRLVLASMVTK